MTSPHSLDLDWRLRLAAMDALARITAHTGGRITRAQIDAGFDFEGEHVRFAAAKGLQGIWRPSILGRSGAALSMLTAAPKEGQTPKYDDEIGAKDGVLRYRYRGSNPDAYDNVAARRAFQLHLPLIYFRGVVPGIYTAIWPAYIIEDDPEQLVFSTVASSSLATQELATTPEFVTLHKAYTERVVKQRLHQDRFRELVVTVYRKRCAVCRLHHPELLDAAHILEDRDERGLPEIPNGLALCKIHHAAYDVNILGISPDFRIEIRDDILEEHDGPMLQHGLKEMDGTRLHLPAKTVHHPKQEYLGIRYERFLAA